MAETLLMAAPHQNAAPGVFLTTRWSRVVRAGDGDGKDAQTALGELCRDYWRPLYFYARRLGHLQEDAEDMTQGFIMSLLASNSFARATPDRGRFRTFLLGAFGNYRANWKREQSALKRGGAVAMFSMDAYASEAEFAREVPDNSTPESAYARSWALALLDKVMEHLREEYVAADRGTLFGALQPHLAGGGPRPGYAQLSEDLGLSENALTVALHRMRKRYGALLREEIAATVEDASEVEDELRFLMQVLSG